MANSDKDTFETSAQHTDVDVVVAGAGGAGLAAALRLAELGASVALLEMTEHFQVGNNTSMSTSMIPAGGSRWQAAVGIDDSPTLFSLDIASKTAGSADKELTSVLTNCSPTLVEWLADHVGVPLELVTDFVYPGHSVARCHSVSDRSGKTLLQHLLSAVHRYDAISLGVPMRVRSVEPASDGKSIRVGYQLGDGSVEELKAGSVVLATGGFGANHDLTARYIPEIANAMYHGGDGCRGDALEIANSLGADLAYLDAYQGHGSVAVPQSIILTWAVQVHGGIILNNSGRRFANEARGYSEFARIVVNEPESIAYAVLDHRVHELCMPFADYIDIVGSGALSWCDDAASLAASINASDEAVASELDEWARVTAGVVADRFDRPQPPAGLEPPYGVIKITGALFHTQGGPRVDQHARMLANGTPIPGVYAAGGAAAGISGHGPAGYLAGNGLLSALGLGYLAGSHAAARHLAENA